MAPRLVWGQPDLLTQAPRAVFRALVRAMPAHPANAVKASLQLWRRT